MKKITTHIKYVIFLLLLCDNTNAQNIFPSTGRVGIYTTSPAATLQVKGGARIGTTANYLNIDSATGNLSFKGTAVYQVANNQYAFQNAANPGIGLYFNATNARYEFRNSASSPTFYVGATTGNGVFTGNLKVGAYTLPATDGANGQVLKTNGAGSLTWSTESNTAYTAGTGISIASNVITNTAPDKIVTIAPATNMAVIGNYPNFALSFVSQPWFTNGNAGTNPATDFIGTTDAQPLVFKVNNIRAAFLDNSGNGNASFGYQGLLANTSGFQNTAMGFNSLKVNTTGNRNTGIGASALYANNADNNTAIGDNALSTNTSGTNNTATGVNALLSNTTGNSNTANGVSALTSNTTGGLNTANGYVSLFLNTTGQQNTATGYASLYSNDNGNYNTAHGTAALNSNVSGSWNTANGAYAMYLNTNSYYNTATGGNALYSNTLGTNNTANGYNALYNNTANNNTGLGSGALYGNTTGQQNTATGSDALHFNTTGYDNTAYGVDVLLSNTIGYDNTSTGTYSLQTNTTGSENTATGTAALTNNSTGNVNVAEGYAAMYNNTTGGVNTAVGTFALSNNQTGSNNTGIGAGAGPTSTNLSYTITIGSDASTTASNQVRIGSVGLSSDPTSIGGKVGWSTLSDGRAKKNIKENVPGLSFIKKLKPITYNIDNDAINKIVQRPAIKGKDGKEIKLSADDPTASKTEEQIVHTGFIAQDVEKAAKSLNYDFSGVDAAKNDKDLYGLRYAEFVVPLVKAVQELSSKNDDLQKQIDDLKAMLVSNQSSASKQQSVILSSVSLEQNIPNPFANTTTINYTLPQKFATAQIIITDNTGKTIKAVNVSGSGKGNLNVDAATLASGSYNYSLIVDGKLIGTKQMVLAK